MKKWTSLSFVVFLSTHYRNLRQLTDTQVQKLLHEELDSLKRGFFSLVCVIIQGWLWGLVGGDVYNAWTDKSWNLLRGMEVWVGWEFLFDSPWSCSSSKCSSSKATNWLSQNSSCSENKTYIIQSFSLGLRAELCLEPHRKFWLTCCKPSGRMTRSKVTVSVHDVHLGGPAGGEGAHSCRASRLYHTCKAPMEVVRCLNLHAPSKPIFLQASARKPQHSQRTSEAEGTLGLISCAGFNVGSSALTKQLCLSPVFYISLGKGIIPLKKIKYYWTSKIFVLESSQNPEILLGTAVQQHLVAESNYVCGVVSSNPAPFSTPCNIACANHLLCYLPFPMC